jgi:peptidyl-prolyl cis-trans isomerase SurA
MNTLNACFTWTLDATLRASLLAGAVLLIQAALSGRISARWRYALWLPVLFVLVVPVLPQSRWSAEHFFALKVQALDVPTDTDTLMVDLAPMPVADSSHAVGTRVSDPAASIDWRRVIVVTWLIGALGSIVGGASFYLATMRRIRLTAMPASPTLTALVQRLCGSVKLRRAPFVRVSPRVDSPAVAGLWRPVLLLPAAFERAFSEAETELVLKHELMHLKRHDLPVNALLCVLQALHWFNPLLWFAASRARQDRESACDAQVLASAERDCRNDYGHALLKVQAAYCPRGFSLGFVGIFEGSAAVHARIKAIAAYRRVHPLMGALAAALTIGLGIVGATRAQTDEGPKNEDAASQIKLTADKAAAGMKERFAAYKALLVEAQKLQKEAQDPVLSAEARAKSAAELSGKLKEVRAIEKEIKDLQQQREAAQSKPEPADAGAVAASVNGKPILASDLADAVAAQRQKIRYDHRNNPKAADEALAKLKTTVLDSLIERELVIEEFKKMGGSIKAGIVEDDINKIIQGQFKGDREKFTAELAKSGTSMSKFKELREKMMIVQIMRSKHAGAQTPPTPAEVEAYYKQHAARWRDNDMVKLRTITLSKHSDEKDSTPEKLKQRAEELRTKLVAGDDFALAAKTHSHDSRAEAGGEWPWMKATEISPALRGPALETKEGTIAPVIEDVGNACILLQVEARKLGEVAPLEKVRGEIEKAIKAERSKIEIDKWLESLKRKTEIKIL